ncbi:MAG: hypothetical protein WCO23_03360 [bacterium]
MKNHAIKHFILGLVIGIISVIFNYASLAFIVGKDFNSFSSANTVIVIVVYGVITMIIGLGLETLFVGQPPKKAQKAKKTKK